MVANGPYYKKRLEGIQSTPELRALLRAITNLSVAAAEPVNHSTGSVVASATAPLPSADALSILAEHSKKENDSKDMIPISVIKAIQSVISPDKKRLSQLEEALSSTVLVFTPPPAAEEQTAEQRKFKRRMDRLKLRAEENRYKNLTSNLSQPLADDVTTRSMTYAASVGLNMIIAPLSFGAFMYFFAGQLFSWIASDEEVVDPNKTDIRRVIAGVVCGVGMLFIEMILFVIRTHEFDAHLRKKSKKKSPSPFGYTKPKELPPS